MTAIEPGAAARLPGIAGALRLGVATVDITPERPVALAGFAHRRTPFDRVERRLYAKVWLFEQARPDVLGGEPMRAAVVQADLIWWGSERMPRLYREAEARWGIRESALFLHATHTHGSPQTSGRFAPSLGTVDEAYVRELESRLLSALGEAAARTEPVAAERGRGECRIGIHRRRLGADGAVAMAPNPDGPVDPEVTVVRFRGLRGGGTKGVWLHYSCHPTTTGDNAVTSEFPGAAMELVERETGAPVSFLQGCCGDVRPALIADGEFVRGTADDVTAYGRELAETALRALAAPMEPLAPAALASAGLTVPLPLRPLPGRDELAAAAGEDDIRGEWGRLLLAAPERLRPDAPLEVRRLVLAAGLSLVAFNAEMVGEYGRYLKRLTVGEALPLAYTNGMIGYVPTAEQAEQGGYEGRESAAYFGLPAPFAPEAEPAVKKALRRLLGLDGYT